MANFTVRLFLVQINPSQEAGVTFLTKSKGKPSAKSFWLFHTDFLDCLAVLIVVQKS
jgi:hypothetical protein